jgi:hypothetical protein
MEKKYNCFKCEKPNINCDSYLAIEPNLDVCVWKNVAKEDLKKYKSGKGEITLYDMLREYLEEKQE